MINCKECGFKVDNKLRYSLMKNECPACGKELFSAQDMNSISAIQGRVLLQSFSDKFNEADTFDISLFIFNEIKNEVAKVAPTQASIESDKEMVAVEGGSEFDPDEIRKQVEQEIPAVANLPTTSQEESAKEKADRLRRVAAQSPFGKKTGPSVKRVG